MAITIVLSTSISLVTVVLIVLGILMWIANNPSNAERIAYWVCSSLRWVSRRSENNAVKRDVTHRINDFAVRLQKEVYGYTPPGLELKIVGDAESTEAFLDAGKLVVRLQPRSGRDLNFLTVAVLFVAHTAFPVVKLKLHENQRRGLDLTLTQDIVERERPELIPTFIREWLNPAISDDGSLERMIDHLARIDAAGLFLPILCQELHFLEERPLTTASREGLRNEVRQFVAFLHRLALRRVGEEIPMQFQGAFLRIGIQIVSRAPVRQAHAGDPGPWLRFAVETERVHRPDRIYFVGSAGEENRRLIGDVASGFCRRTGWEPLFERRYRCEILSSDGDAREVENFLAVCRRTGREHRFASGESLAALDPGTPEGPTNGNH
jgi:hypothetical protein